MLLVGGTQGFKNGAGCVLDFARRGQHVDGSVCAGVASKIGLPSGIAQEVSRERGYYS